MTKIALIGGTGLSQMPGLEQIKQQQIDTPYGAPSAELTTGVLAGCDVVFLPRHGNPHRIPPHVVNYRANIWALHNIGVQSILAVNAVGGITTDMDAGAICIPDQIVDYTYGREHSYSDSASAQLQHIDFSYPYDQTMREQLITAAQVLNIQASEQGVYAATQGPRLESAAEINRLERDGCDVVGMTGMPEAALARELSLPYACLCLVVNKGAGRSESIITMAEIEAVMASGMITIQQLIQQFLTSRVLTD